MKTTKNIKNTQRSYPRLVPRHPLERGNANLSLFQGGGRRLGVLNCFGFTLVELIVVITILVILGTIAFINLQGFSGSARDSDRVTTVKNMENGLSIFQIKSGSYPAPESPTGTGVINGNIYSTVGIIGNTLSSIMRMNTLPTDPLSKSHYIYGINPTGTQYQIAITLENAIVYNPSIPGAIIPSAYASTSLQALVNGNYPGYIKFSSGATETWIANIPSLLFSNTGSTNLLSTGTYFLVNKQSNLPYKLSTTDTIQNKNANELIQSITSSNTTTLTGVNITNIKTFTDVTTKFTGSLLASFGGNIANVETIIIGKTPVVAVTTFTCGTSTVTAGGYIYTTILGPDKKCWTSQNMKHTPSAGNRWTYGSEILYDWTAATSDLCSQLGIGWALPTDAQWTALTSAGTAGWTGNKLSGIISSLPGFRGTDSSFYNQGTSGYWWSSSQYDAPNAWDRSLNSGTNIASTNNSNKTNGFSVVCFKN